MCSEDEGVDQRKGVDNGRPFCGQWEGRANGSGVGMPLACVSRQNISPPGQFKESGAFLSFCLGRDSVSLLGSLSWSFHWSCL